MERGDQCANTYQAPTVYPALSGDRGINETVLTQRFGSTRKCDAIHC